MLGMLTIFFNCLNDSKLKEWVISTPFTSLAKKVIISDSFLDVPKFLWQASPEPIFESVTANQVLEVNCV